MRSGSRPPGRCTCSARIPSQCVRYDVNAVYLGTPGPNPDCPAHLVGRADTVSIGGPAAPGEPSTPVRTDLRAAVGAKRAGARHARRAGHDHAEHPAARARRGHARQRPGHHRHVRDQPRPEIMQVLAGVHQITQQSAPTGTAAANSGQQPSGHAYAGSLAVGRRAEAVAHRAAASAVPQAADPGVRTAGGRPGAARGARPRRARRRARPATWIPPSWPVPAPTGTGSPTPAGPWRHLPRRRPRRPAPWPALTPAAPRRCRP